MPDTILIAVISMLGAVMVALIGNNYFRKRQPALPDPEQDKLVKTLQDLVEAQDAKIEHLEEAGNANTKEIKALRAEIAELRKVIVSQAVMIETLTKTNNAPEK